MTDGLCAATKHAQRNERSRDGQAVFCGLRTFADHREMQHWIQITHLCYVELHRDGHWPMVKGKFLADVPCMLSHGTPLRIASINCRECTNERPMWMSPHRLEAITRRRLGRESCKSSTSYVTYETHLSQDCNAIVCCLY